VEQNPLTHSTHLVQKAITVNATFVQNGHKCNSTGSNTANSEIKTMAHLLTIQSL